MQLRELRIARKMTQREVANALCIPVRTYQNYERGVNSPDVDLICEMADFFDVSVDSVVGHQKPGRPMRCDVCAQNEDESRLLESFRVLSSEGRTMVEEFARLLSTNDKFRDGLASDMFERI